MSTTILQMKGNYVIGYYIIADSITVVSSSAFAIRDIRKGIPITLYSGLHMTNQEQVIFDAAEKVGREHFTEEDDELYFPTKYHGSVPECRFTITIPWRQGSLNHFRATLGHKLNHSFKPNCEYGGILDSPRFGLVRAFHTNRDIQKGEELFISYGYSASSGPKWYRQLYDHIMETEGEAGFNPGVLSSVRKRGDREKGGQNDNKGEKSVQTGMGEIFEEEKEIKQ